MEPREWQVQGFRSIANLDLSFDPGLTTLVGENNTGKSTISLAILRLFTNAAAGNTDSIQGNDYPYGVMGAMRIEACIRLTKEEAGALAGNLFGNSVAPVDRGRIIAWAVETLGDEIVLTLTRPTNRPGVTYAWGGLRIFGNIISRREIDPGASGQAFERTVRGLKDEDLRPKGELERLLDSTQLILAMDGSASIGRPLLDSHRRFEEFRAPLSSGRTNELESFAGGSTASVLFNLKNHSDVKQRNRYRQVLETFRYLFPRYSIEAVEVNPGPSAAEVLFYLDGVSRPLPLANVSAGTQQLLTLVTNLVGRDGLILFIEHPETHLHPHGMRFIQRLLLQSLPSNQIVVMTHDPNFVLPNPHTIRRVWLTGQGSKATGPSSLSAIQTAQVQTALRDSGKRELLFARAVILVEDESQREFLSGVSRTVGVDLDASSISVVSVDGDQGYGAYFTVLESFGIPFVALKDKLWGDDKRYPRARFFSTGVELEDFLDSEGLRDRRLDLQKTVGTSKRRVAGALARALTDSEVPALFKSVLSAALALATGEPSTGAKESAGNSIATAP